MKITVLNARDVTAAHWEAWRSIQQGNPDLDSPYFCADYVRIAGSVRDDVSVAVLGSAQDPEGFFSFQRRRGGFGIPVGDRLSDFQAVIAPRNTAVDVPALMRACGLVTFEFNGLLASQTAFAPYFAETIPSPYLDTSGGVEGYDAARRAAGSDQPRRLRSFRRKAQEKFGKVEFVPHVTDPKVLDTLLEWKSRQYQESGTIDNWSFEWMRTLMHRIHEHQGPDFGGIMSAVYFDGEPVAVHMGMRSRTAWHWWIPRHDERFSEWRPGLLMLHLMIEHAPALGVKRIDLGYGDEEYKKRLKSGEFPVARGRVEMPSFALTLKRWREGLESWVRRTPLMPIVRIPGRLYKRLETWNRHR